jgi:hypothetical protein
MARHASDIRMRCQIRVEKKEYCAVCDQHQDKMKNDNQRNKPIYKTTAGPPLQELQLSSIDDEMNEDMKLHSFRLMWARRK